MSLLLGIVLIYSLMFLGWTSVGLLLIVAPARVGNLLHESFGLCSQVKEGDWGKKLILRAVGAGFLAFALRFAFGIVALSRN